MDIEEMACSAIKRVIAKTDCLKLYGKSEDREPSWDGNIYVYKTAGDNHSNKDFIGRVPIQIKGQKTEAPIKDKISYTLEITEIKNYLKDGGLIFFVVCFDSNGEKEKIYYKSLLPFDLKQILNNVRNDAKSKNIYFKPFPMGKRECENLILNILHDREKQLASISLKSVALEDVLKFKENPDLTFSYTPLNDKPLVEDIFDREMYLYLKLEQGVMLPVAHIDKIEEIIEERSGTVVAGGKEYYALYKVIHQSNEEVKLYFGESSVFSLDFKQKKLNFYFKLQGTLHERVNDVTFLINVLKSRGFCINDRMFSITNVTDNEIESEIIELEKTLHLLQIIQSTMDILKVQKDLDMNSMNSCDFHNLDKLIRSLYDNELVELNDTGCPIGFYKVANLNLLVSVLKDPDTGRFSIRNFFGQEEIRYAVPDRENKSNMVPCPLFTILDKDSILKCCNLDVDAIIEELKEFTLNDAAFEQVNGFLLEVLKAYDTEGSNKSLLINLAKKIVRELLEKDTYNPREILRLNELQIIKRQRPLNIDEKYELMELAKNIGTDDDQNIALGCYLLLDEQDEASKLFYGLNEDRQKEFSGYPIFRFWKGSKVNKKGN